MTEQELIAPDKLIIHSFTMNGENQGRAIVELPDTTQAEPIRNIPDYPAFLARSLILGAATQTLRQTAQSGEPPMYGNIEPTHIGSKRLAPDILSRVGNNLSVEANVTFRFGQKAAVGHAIIRDETSPTRKRVGVVRNIGLVRKS